MRINLHPAYILHHRPYRETSVLLDLLTHDHGKISLIARGIRTERSRLRAVLQPFVPLLISWQGKSELMLLTGAEAVTAPLYLRGDCLLSGFYLNELMMRLLHKHDSHPRLYTIYQDTLLELQSGQLHQKTLRIFEKKLLEELGYGLHLAQDYSTGKELMADAFYLYHPDQGFIQCEEVPPEQHHLVYAGKSLLALSNEQFEAESELRDAKRLMRTVLATLLGKPLQSRKLFIA